MKIGQWVFYYLSENQNRTKKSLLVYFQFMFLLADRCHLRDTKLKFFMIYHDKQHLIWYTLSTLAANCRAGIFFVSFIQLKPSQSFFRTYRQ